MARVALVNLASLPMPGNTEPVFPIGLRCVQDALDRAGHVTRLIDFVANPEQANDLSWTAEPWDIIGFTIRNIDPIDLACDGHVEHYETFVARVRSALSGQSPLLIGGGPGYSLFSEPLLARLDLDLGVIGPGEQRMVEIAANPNSYRGTRRNLAGTRFEGFVKNFLDHPVSLLNAYTRYRDSMLGIETRRKTCYQGCVYCPYAYISGDNQGDHKPLELIAAELQAAYRAGVRKIFFTDAIFNSEIKFAKQVVQTIISANLPELTWSGYFTPRPFDDEFAGLLADSGLEYVLISPDSLDDRMMRVLGKRFDTRHLDRCIERCRRHGLTIRVNIVFGGPSEDRESVRNSSQYANSKLAAEELVMSIGYRVLPETGLGRQLGLGDSDLLNPTFFPFSGDLFTWIMEDLDSRFMTPRAMLNLLAGRSAAKQMTRLSVPASADSQTSDGYPSFALSRIPKEVPGGARP